MRDQFDIRAGTILGRNRKVISNQFYRKKHEKKTSTKTELFSKNSVSFGKNGFRNRIQPMRKPKLFETKSKELLKSILKNTAHEETKTPRNKIKRFGEIIPLSSPTKSTPKNEFISAKPRFMDAEFLVSEKKKLSSNN